MTIHMENNVSRINTILEVVYKEAEIFLIENENIDIIDAKKWKNNPLKERISLIDFNGEINIKILFCIEEELFQVMFQKCFPTMNEDEREDLEDAFPDEIINLIVGLSIRHLPKELSNITLGVPYKMSSENLDSFFSNNHCETITLSTQYGNISINIADNF